MDWHGPHFVIAIIAMAMAAGLIKTWIRAKHGYPLSKRDRRQLRRQGGGGDLDEARENERLTGQVSRLEDRIAVLERIVTDPAHRLDREIDALR